MNPWDILTWAVALGASVIVGAVAVAAVAEVVRVIRKNTKK